MTATAVKPRKASKPKFDVYQAVTDRIIGCLEAGTVPWRQPWTAMGGHCNLVSKKPYRGINQILLSLSEYDSPWWLTYKQAAALGGQVRAGEKGTLITFWKTLRVESDERDAKGKPVVKMIPLLRHYTVFNAEQVDGIDAKIPVAAEREFAPVELCEQVIAGMPSGPSLGHGGDNAYYSPPADHVQVPSREAFDDEQAYYSTVFHELVHATGHASRLDRPEVTGRIKFGSDDYSSEELVAEMGAAMLCGATGIEPRAEQSAAYVAHWLASLRNDKKLVIRAAGKGQKAADYIQGLEVEA